MPKNRGKKNSGRDNPKDEVVVYTGPIKLPVSATPNDSEVVRMSYIYGQTGSSVGLQSYYGTSNVNSCPDWTKFAALYDEYRVLGFEVDYWPSALDGSSQVVSSSGMAITSHSPTNPFPFTNVAAMCDYGNVRPFYTGRPLTLKWKMASTEEAQYTATPTTSTMGWVGWWAPGATTTATAGYGYAMISFAVQFRGRV